MNETRDRRRRVGGRAPRVAVTGIALGLAGVGIALAVFVFSASAEPNEDLLVVDESGRVSLLDTASGRPLFELSGAVVTPDRSAILTTEPSVSGTVIESRDPATGAVTGTTTVVGELEIRAVSPRGDAIALLPPRESDVGLYVPEPRSTTEVTIAFTDERPAVRYSLEGNYEPEMFSYDATTLYLLQFEPAESPDHYLVRELDVASGLVGAVKSTQVDLQPEMRGVARAQVVAPDGRRVYTAYTIPSGADPVHDVADPVSSERWAFIHVLDLEEGYDFCIFLPVPMGTVNEATMDVGISPDGRVLYVVDPASALVARIDTETLELTTVYEAPDIRHLGARADVAVTDAADLFVGIEDRVTHLLPWESAEGDVGVSTLGGWSFPGPVSGLSVTASNRQLRLASAGAVVVIDLATAEEVRTFVAPAGGGDLTILGPPSGDVTRIPFECAC